MDKTIEGIVLRSVEFKDNDRIVTLLTREEGKFTIRMRGVKNPKSKLRQASHPFYYGKYTLTRTKTGYVVTGVDTIKNFDFSLSSLSFYYVAALIIEIAEKLSLEEYEDVPLFEFTIKSLSNIDLNKNPLQLASELLRDFLVIAGHGLKTDFDEYINGFSFEDGGLCDLKKSSGMKLTTTMIDGIKNLLNYGEVNASILPNVLSLISSYFTANTTKKLNTPEQIIAMYDILV